MKKYTMEKIIIQSDAQPMDLYVLKPKNKNLKDKTPGILWIHGGGYMTGKAKMVLLSRAMALVKKYGAIVLSPEYRLSKEAPYPAALNDCYAALKYLKANAETLGVNDSQIMVGGESAGGGLTIATCLYARDKGEVQIAYQMPLYPMIDDRDTESSRDNHDLVWNTKRNHKGWQAYLGDLRGNEVPSYAAPARANDYSGLPPAYTFVGNREPFYCETIAYIENLNRLGIEAKVDVYANWFHAYDIAFPFTKKAKRAAVAFEKQYLYAVKHYFAEQIK